MTRAGRAAPAASQWAPAAVPSEPPEALLDFPLLVPGVRFTPDPDDPATGTPEGAFVTARWLPVRWSWGATATILEATPQHLRWLEELPLTPRVRFRADVTLVRSGPHAARLTSRPRLGRRELPALPQDYEVVIAERELLGLRAADRDVLSVVRMTGRVVQFHMRLPFGIAIHKSGVVDPP